MVKQRTARADAQSKATADSSLLLEHSQPSGCTPTVFECELEHWLYLAALSDVRTILKNLADLRATRVSKSLVQFISKHEIFAPLLNRLTKNYWLTLTDEEKAHRGDIRRQSVALKKAQALLDGISVRKKIAKKFFKAHQLNQPIRLSNVELAWLDGNPECRALVSVKSNFLIPTSRNAFDFSEDAFARLAARLRFEMLTPNDVDVLKSHGAPILPDNTLSLDDAAWAREPYAKAVLYRLVKYRKDEQEAQAEHIKRVATPIEKPFKRIHLSEDECSVEPIPRDFKPATPTHIAQTLKRIDLESDDLPCEILISEELLPHRWVDEVKGKMRSLFGLSTKVRAFAR